MALPDGSGLSAAPALGSGSVMPALALFGTSVVVVPEPPGEPAAPALPAAGEGSLSGVDGVSAIGPDPPLPPSTSSGSAVPLAHAAATDITSSETNAAEFTERIARDSSTSARENGTLPHPSHDPFRG